MIPFVLGHLVVFGSVCTVSLIADRRQATVAAFWFEPLDWRGAVLLLLVLPAATAWITLDVLQRARPRRWLDDRVPRAGGMLIAGLVSSVLAVCAVAVAFAWLDGVVPAWAILSGAVLLTTSATFLALPRLRRGRCVQCGYDISERTPDGRCPECGTLDPA